MELSLKPRHAARYREIARLLARHVRPEWREAFVEGPGGAPEADVSTEDAEELVDDLEAMGPTFVKLGQLLSTRADLLAPSYIEALSRLQDDVEPFPFDDVRA